MPAFKQLKESIGFKAAVSIIVGSVIGSGIFMKPASMASELGSPIWLIIVWVIAGVFSLFGALIYAEIGAMLPETGGQYVYFRYMYGKFVAFLYGWSAFAVINTASVAAISFVCAEYANYFLHLPRLDAVTEHRLIWHIPFIGNLYPLENLGVKLLAIALVIVLTFLNYCSANAGNRMQVIFTVVKIAVIALLIIGIFFCGKGTVEHFMYTPQPKQGISILSGIIAALTGAFMAYDGWINITFVGGEIRNPQRVIPNSLFTGLFICIMLYVFVNLAYLYVLPINQIATSPLVATDAIAIALGKSSSSIVAALIVICTFGAINGNTMATARVTYAMAKDHVFLPWVGKEDKRFHTPGNALWLHAVWTSLFIISGSFDMLADMFTFIAWVAYLMGAIGIFILRKKMANAIRPYKA